jgi:amino acid adenylation domain-containing protein
VDWPFEPIPPEALEGSLNDRVLAIAARYPDRLAVQDMTRSLTFRELAALADGVGRQVAGLADPDGPVAILLPSDARAVAAMLGVLGAGRAAVPLDTDHPPDRNRRIAEHAGATAVISAGELAEAARRLFPARVRIIDVDRLEDLPPAAGAGARRPGPDDPAFILYTSGSTGEPKGVVQPHRNILYGMKSATDAGHFNPDDRFIMVYSASVIGGIRNAFMALLNGASIHMMSPQALGAAGLVEEIRRRGITMFMSVPTVLRRIADALGPGERLGSVRQARLGGDRVEWRDVAAARRIFAPDVHVNISAGSTECSTTYVQWFVDDALRAGDDRLPIGRPLPGLDLRILDPEGMEVADGSPGEIVVSSRYLARGYWREPGMTAAAFQPDPEDHWARVFRTGDMGVRRPDGLIEFAGRKDDLVKLRGHRIEPAEIERALRGCMGVADAAVHIRRRPSGEASALVAYVELEPNVQGLLPRHIMAMASRSLPAFMRPSIAFVLDALPRLAILKIDRAALARMDSERVVALAERTQDPLLDEVAQAFEHVLKTRGATADDTLLSLGGDSLQAIDVVLELERRLGVSIELETFRQSASIRSLARTLIPQEDGGAWPET